jgi:signal transduction histidine kinase
VALPLALVILAGTILVGRDQLRDRIREQIIARDGEILHAVALTPLYGGDAGEPGLESIEDPATQLTLMLRTSKLRGVLAAHLIGTDGDVIQSFPVNARDGGLEDGDLDRLKALQPVSRFHPSVPLGAIVWPTDADSASANRRVPMLEVNIPLHGIESRRLAGVAQFLIEGTSIEREFGRLESHLNQQAAAAFLVAGSILTGVVGLALRRLRNANRLLKRRSAELVDANRELVQTAKTSAVGAVTSHLIHELKNPLSGLHNLVTGCAQSPGMASELPAAQWREAAAATRRMRDTIAEIVALLREDQSAVHYQLTLEEVGDLVRHRLDERAKARRIRIVTEVSAVGNLGNRQANLVALILANLGENALLATPEGGTVTIRIVPSRSLPGIRFEVEDQGPGIPASRAESVFHPVSSTHEGGSGLGLAICKQLANHLGATLTLERNSAQGCRFALELAATWGMARQLRQGQGGLVGGAL